MKIAALLIANASAVMIGINDDHDDAGGWCNNVHSTEYSWTDPDGNEQSGSYAGCYDICTATGGVIEEKIEQYEGGWSKWYECVNQECDDFEHV